jgi:glycosyltransferase involved in cell wall biosynthesis
VGEEVVFCRDLPGPDGRGFVPTDRVMADLYALSDALLLPSVEEGFGLPLLEAAVFRTPVFATNLGPFREIGGDAIQMFGIDDTPAACARQIVHALMDDRAYRLRRRTLATYRWEVVMRERIVPLLLQHAPAPRP